MEPRRKPTKEEMDTNRQLFSERLETIVNIIEKADELDPKNRHVAGDIRGLNLLNDMNMIEIQSVLAMDLDKYTNGAKMELNGMEDGRTVTITKDCYNADCGMRIYKYSVEVEIRKGDLEGVYQGVDF